MAQLLPYRVDYCLWKYVPSITTAVIFNIIFLGISSAHTWRMIKTKTKFFWPFTIGCWMEAIGYIGRAMAVKRTNKLMPYIIQTFFSLVAPAMFAASIYMTLGHIVRSVRGKHDSTIKVSRLTKIFVLGDVMSFMIVSFGLFFVCAVIWMQRMEKMPTYESYTTESPWKQSMYMLYTVSIAIFARSIFRCVEYAQGQSGYFMSNEWTLYIFDSVPMFVVTVVFLIRYPSRLQAPLAPVEEHHLGAKFSSK